MHTSNSNRRWKNHGKIGDYVSEVWKKGKYIIGLCSAVGITLIVWWCNTNKNFYDEHIADFEEITVDDIHIKQKNEKKFFLYVGRESCEYCLYFVHGLSEAVQKEKIKIYYLDSITEYEKSDEVLKTFRDEFDIKRVPALIYYEGGNEKSRFDVSKGDYSAEKISDFLRKCMEGETWNEDF